MVLDKNEFARRFMDGMQAVMLYLTAEQTPEQFDFNKRARTLSTGYLMPDRGQERIERCDTAADFFYVDWKAPVFIDGPHHDVENQADADAAINKCLEGAGYYVVRFPKEVDRWPEIFATHASLFGTGKQ